MTIAQHIVEKATQTGQTVTTAESCTGGMVAAAITDIAGSSAAFERGFVTYSNLAKTEMLGVSPATLEAHGAVSEEVVREMAMGARGRRGRTWRWRLAGLPVPAGLNSNPRGGFATGWRRPMASQPRPSIMAPWVAQRCARRHGTTRCAC